MLVIIPLGGLGSRFTAEGYRLPKPLIKAHGKEMIYHVIDNLNLLPSDQLVIVYKNDLNQYRFDDLILKRYPQTMMISLNHQTRGAAETLWYGLTKIEPSLLAMEVVTIDCDTFYSSDILSQYRQVGGNGVFCFQDTQHKPIFSYIKFDSTHQIREIAEKVRISDYANSGCYCFRSGEVLRDYCRQVIELNLMQKGELYISSVIKKMIEEQETFHAHLLSQHEIHCLGTPIQLKIFCSSHLESEPRRICFDLDNTLVTHPRVPGDYATVQPITPMINLVRRLQQLGHTIIIYTARRMRTHQGNIGGVLADIGPITFDTLSKFKIPYDEIYFGKPYAHVYIDDLAIPATEDLEKELGFYHTSVEEREFNQIKTNKIETITKTGTPEQISGEIYWYQHIPSSVTDLFPTMYRYDPSFKFYELEKIKGVTMSYLYVNQSLTPLQLTRYLKSIDQIHNCPVVEEDLPANIYQNYQPKLQTRYHEYDYSNFPQSEKVYQTLMDYLTQYQEEQRGKISVIHGDPVFSNCIVDTNDNFKLIDMRGKLGEELTILGDRLYDLSKIYQSLLGYDEILLDKIMSIEYKHKLQNVFREYIYEQYGESVFRDIQMITNSLLFSLIPLHDNDRCYRYYHLINLEVLKK